MPRVLTVRRLGLCDYEPVRQAMRDYTELRDSTCGDEIWLLEHPPIFTLGRAGAREHLLAPGDIPVLRVERGGQVTYHGPGQLVMYVLFDLHAAGLSVRQLVQGLEQAVIDMLAVEGIQGERRSGAPGIYVAGSKVAALGLRIRRGCSYHGLALNVAMDLEPYQRIHPCGYSDLEVTQLRDLDIDWSLAQAGEALAQSLAANFAYELRDGGQMLPVQGAA